MTYSIETLVFEREDPNEPYPPELLEGWRVVGILDKHEGRVDHKWYVTVLVEET